MNLSNREEKICDIRKIIIDKLDLARVLSKDDFTLFCVNLTNFLRYSRNNNLLEKTNAEIDVIVDRYIIFMENLAFNKTEVIESLSNNFSLLDYISKDNFIDKYILLSVLENDANDVRKKLLKENSKVLSKSLEEIYVRYALLRKTGREFNITNLVKESFSDFIESFVIKGYLYDTKNKIFTSKKSLEELIEMFPIDFDFINELKKKKINKRVSFIRDLTPDEKRRLAVKNYSKVSNISELSSLLNISKSSLQRYLKNDSKKLTSKEEYQRILEWLKNAKETGLSKGGTVSQEQHSFAKDKSGKFMGSGAKK